jgi:hypothetical protein
LHLRKADPAASGGAGVFPEDPGVKLRVYNGFSGFRWCGQIRDPEERKRLKGLF